MQKLINKHYNYSLLKYIKINTSHSKNMIVILQNPPQMLFQSIYSCQIISIFVFGPKTTMSTIIQHLPQKNSSKSSLILSNQSTQSKIDGLLMNSKPTYFRIKISPQFQKDIDQSRKQLKSPSNLSKESLRTLQFKPTSQVKKYLNISNINMKLVHLLTTFFPGFQDHAIYKGHQIFFYKRAQIFVGDLYAAFQGKGYGEFDDIDQLTMFPDYRVPQILNEKKVLEYSEELSKLIKDDVQIEHGSVQEIEIRACCVQAVEMIKQLGNGIMSIEIDWILWQIGEEQKEQIVKHHKTLSIYY